MSRDGRGRSEIKGCEVLAYRFGFASILGAFAAGLLVRLVEVSGREPNELFLTKLEGIGFGFLGFNLKDLLDHPSALVEVPLFLVALLVVRGVPALVAAGLLSAALFPAGADRILARGRKAASARSRGPVTALRGSRTSGNARNHPDSS